MWTLLLSKTFWICVGAAGIMILVGVLLLRNASLKSQIAKSETKIVDLQAQLKNAQDAVTETKTSLANREKEIQLAQAQVEAGNKAVQEYKKRMDRASDILSKAKCVKATEKMGVIDEQANDEIIDNLNCLTDGICPRVLPQTGSQN